VTDGTGALRLTLVRHGHATPQAPAGQTDFDRMLDRKGEAEAMEMARRCLELGLVPDLVRSSAAARARDTAATFARIMGLSDERLSVERNLYLAEADTLLAAVRETDSAVRHLMLVAHNPGLGDLAQQFAPRARLRGFETGAVCTLELRAAGWAEVRLGNAEDLRYDAPGRFYDVWS
jgi:phosphohistidine phosphatase